MTAPRRTVLQKMLAVAGFALLVLSNAAGAADWPVYQHDNQRSGATSEALDAAALREAWVYRSPQPPDPAWAGPAKWDAFKGIRGLRSMRDYDPVFHAIVAGRSLYFGSSADDSVHSLDTQTGEERWSFTTGGPIRIAPAFADGRIYFGSDDGHAYAVEAASGALVWKRSPAPAGQRLILNNGRFIPFWPCRTGVLVDRGIAYFACSLLPWKESYLCAVGAATGKGEGPGTFIKTIDAATLEGSLVASPLHLIVPQGRVPPRLFDRRNGDSLGELKGGGGCFVLLTAENQILHGPGNKTGWITASDSTTRSEIATYKNGNAMIVAGDRAYLLSDHSLGAIDRRTQDRAWEVNGEYPHALILAGETLFAGGDDEVAAFRARDGKLLWKGAVRGRAQGLAAADGALFASTDEGAIHCFRAASSGQPELAVATREEPLSAEVGARKADDLAAGPYLQFAGPDAAVVRWESKEPSPSVLEYGLSGAASRRRLDDAPLKTWHEARLGGLRRDRVYTYAIETLAGGKKIVTPPFECDTFFNFNLPAIPERPSPYPEDETTSLHAAAARRILAASGVTQGVCIVVGAKRGQLVYELARRSNLNVVGVETDAGSVAAARRALLQAGIYGRRAVVRQVQSLSDLPFSGACANLIAFDPVLAGGGCPGSAGEVFRLLRPSGGIAYLGQPGGAPEALGREALAAWLRADAVEFTPGGDDDDIAGTGGVWAKVVRGPLAGAGEWSHQYGRPDNAAFGGEALRGATRTGDLEVQWLGRPGPRAQPDRNGRKPSPLAAGGRLFVQGLHRIVALDAYNGTILWSLEIPALERFNMPRDASNWCADGDHVFAAIGDRSWRIDAATGTVSKLYPVLRGSKKDWSYDWGYVARFADKLAGSAVKAGTAYTNFWGQADGGWYDATDGPATYKVVSDNLFALAADSGEMAWTYAGGAMLNSTITIGAGAFFFAECRNARVAASEVRRIGLAELWQDLYLVALDGESGRKLWERPLAIEAGRVALYLAHGSGKLVLVSSGAQSYNVYTFDAAGGAASWEAHYPWPEDNHGAHMSRPAIVKNTVFVRPRAFELETGKALALTLPKGGCGTYAASEHAIFYRASNVAVWDPASGASTSWERLRPDCWLSTIPAAGMLLSPEAGGGCSCGGWMETSIGFLPLVAR